MTSRSSSTASRNISGRTTTPSIRPGRYRADRPDDAGDGRSGVDEGITGYATINTALQATQLGAFDYIAKPFTRSELMAVIQRASGAVQKPENDNASEKNANEAKPSLRELKTIGEYSWIMMQDDGSVLMGVERPFLHTIGRILNIVLPAPGDKLRQGSVYFQVFSADLRSHTVLSPLSGTVVAINENVAADPTVALQDPYGEGWLVRLKPSRFEYEIKQLGL